MPVRIAAPVTTLRSRAARSVAKSPYSRANTATKFDAAVDDIIKNCPAVDVLLGGYAASRSSTHSRGRDYGHVSRPPNAFMVYRSYVWFTKQLDKSDEKNLSCVSKLAAESWKEMNAQARTPFHEIAALAKRKHAELHPNYKYAPSSRSEKPTKKKNAPPLTLKAREKAKEAATPTNKGIVAVASPLPRRAIPTDRRSSDVFTCVVPTSPGPSSTSSASSASPPHTPDLEYPYPTPSSPELGYPWDNDLPGFPPRPRFRAVSSGCIPNRIPSPAISVLELNKHESVLDSLPDKYEEAASYHDLHPHALLFNEGPPFDGIIPNTQIVAPPPRQSTIDYSCFISGNPDAKLTSPASTVDHSDAPHLGGCAFSLDPCADITDHTFHSSPSSLFDWASFDMLTLGSGPIADEATIYVHGHSLDPDTAFGIY